MNRYKVIQTAIAPGFLIVFFLLIFKAYYRQIGAFGCFDDCFNFTAAYFMLKGRMLYSEIFFNHQPLMAYISYVIQTILQPDSIYKLVLSHRMFMFAISVLMDILIIVRFRWVGAGFAVFYELTKFYLFGDRFLAEAAIAQPFAYLIGLAWYKLKGHALSLLDFCIAGILTWFIVFMREPYIPAALFIYCVLLWNKKISRTQTMSFGLFVFLSMIVLFGTSIPDYLYVVGEVNLTNTVPYEEKNHGLGLLKGFFYPLYILFDGKWTYLRQILVGLDVVFLTLISLVFIKLKKQKEISLILLALGFSAVRFVTPGTMFYEAFHMLPWYALFLMMIFLLLKEAYIYTKQLGYLLLFFLIGIFSFITLSPQSFLWEKKDKDTEFTTNYASYFVYGETMKLLGIPEDTLFVDLWDDFLYWPTGLDSAYAYGLYTVINAPIPKYKDARNAMFRDNPPDFYYAHCDEGKLLFPETVLPEYRRPDYVQLYTNGKPACLYIKKTKIAQIPEAQWEKVKKLGFYRE